MAKYVNLSLSPEKLVWEIGLFTQAQLELDERHAAILTSWKGSQEALESTEADFRQARHDVIVARSRRENQRFKMQNAFRVFALDLLEITEGNKKSTTYISYFENGYGLYGRMPLEAQLQAAHLLLVRLDSETEEAVKAAGAKFREAVTLAEAAYEDWKAKTQAVRDFRATLHTAKLTWRTAYRRLEGELRALHPDEPRYVASFFVPTASTKARSGRETSENGTGDEGVDTGEFDEFAGVDGVAGVAGTNGIVAEGGAGITNGIGGGNGTASTDDTDGTDDAAGVAELEETAAPR